MKSFLLFFLIICCLFANSQKDNLIYIDKSGVVRFTKDKKEAAFFGVNYTVPFAYGYRSHKALGVDLEKAIDADVHHMSLLGLNAFRVHVWDVEITDSLGNLLDNEHLRLFDYLLYKLKQKNIKILVTPIAFWGNGYPEKDEKTPGFSTVYGKEKSVVVEPAIKAQENYMKQFYTHVNPYTKLSYRDDPDIIATEINNEPKHSGPKEKATEYINRLTTAIKSTGWTKPIFYNISESPIYGDAVVKSNVDGYSFQWYPTGLVANRELKGNFLPNVDAYTIPFGDTIAAFKNKPLMMYEFDAGDVMNSTMYPAMARSYRTAGFWWATQFAYDPMATAYANTEYQTHYLNLVYTPSKAISLLIASKVFQHLPRLSNYGSYPSDTLFDVFSLSYKNDLSEMNSDEEFYYSNSTSTDPKNITALKSIAGVGNSGVVKYKGTGGYFLKQVKDGIWILEVMPDAVTIRDPFEKASPKKEVVRIQWENHLMEINLPQLGKDFGLAGVNHQNKTAIHVKDGSFLISPGVYMIVKNLGENIKIEGPAPFYAPPSSTLDPYINHSSYSEVVAGKSFAISAIIAGIDTTDKVSIEMRNSSNNWKTVSMQVDKPYQYSAEVPLDMVTPGILNYRIMVYKQGATFTFPRGHKGDPYAWDNYINESWETIVVPSSSPVVVFDPAKDRNNIMIYNPDWRNNTLEYITTNTPGELVLKATNNSTNKNGMGFQYYFKDKIGGRIEDLNTFNKLLIKGRTSSGTVPVTISLITEDAEAFSTTISLTDAFNEFEIPLSTLKKDSFLLLPRPYPNFLPLYFSSASSQPFDLKNAERIEIRFAENKDEGQKLSIEIARVLLKQ
jgi:hypothetical protein